MSDKKDTRSVMQRMKDRAKDLDAATEVQTAPPPKEDADAARRKANQSTDKNNYW